MPNNETPAANWANWALIQEWVKNPQNPDVLQFIAQRFAETLSDYGRPMAGPRCVVIATSTGHWQRGKTLVDACEILHDSKKAKVHAWLVLNDGTAEVDQMGCVIADNKATILSLGCVGTVGSILRANAE